MSESKINLLGMDQLQLKEFLSSLGEKPFRVQQLMKWIYHEGKTDFNDMLNLSKVLRAKLSELAEVRAPEVVFEKKSADGTHKWVVRMDNGNDVETVYIPERKRGTLCISSQVGCSLDCTFCSTAQQGFNRNLSAAEILGQVYLARQALEKENLAVTNVVLMGMGEPLLNFKNVVSATNVMIDDLGFGLSRRRVTLSTSGVVPALERLKEVSDVSLAVSLHAPNDELRNKLVPLNKKYPIADLIPACVNYISGKTHRTITWEYVMIDNVNDQLIHARQLAKLLKNVPSKINLIPFNPFPGTEYKRSKADAIRKFQHFLNDAGFVTTVRKTRGDDIDAACGQLVGKVQDKTKRQQFKNIPIESNATA